MRDPKVQALKATITAVILSMRHLLLLGCGRTRMYKLLPKLSQWARVLGMTQSNELQALNLKTCGETRLAIAWKALIAMTNALEVMFDDRERQEFGATMIEIHNFAAAGAARSLDSQLNGDDSFDLSVEENDAAGAWAKYNARLLALYNDTLDALT